MAQLNPYINFGGKTREAMTFYQQALGGELSITTVGDTPMAAQMPPEMKDTIMHSALNNGAIALMATDLGGGPDGDPVVGNNISLSLNCSSEEEINTFFAKLSEGGTVHLPLGEQFWGAIFGHFVDKFGISWMLNYEKNAPQS